MKRKRNSNYSKPFKKHSGSKRRPWTPKEDQAITSLVKSIGTKQWTIVAQQLSSRFSIKGRTGKQCRQRWHNHLNPGIIKEVWTIQQELTLFEQHKITGNKWAKISNHLPGRTDNSIKNHFYSTLRKQFRQLHGIDATREQLRVFSSDLTQRILRGLYSAINGEDASDMDQNFQEMPELMPIEDCELLIKGFQIPLPQPPSNLAYEEAPVEFLQCTDPFFSHEVFMMPLI